MCYNEAMENANVKSNGMFSAEQIEKFQKLKTSMQKGSVWLFVGGAVVAALTIMTGEYDVMGRMMGTIFVIAFFLIFSAAEFARLNSEYKAAQTFSLIGIVANIAWAVLAIASVWGLFEFSSQYCPSGRYYCDTNITFMGKLFVIASSFAGLGFFGCLTMGIKEFNKRQTIMPLKVTAGICLTYSSLFFLLVALEVIKTTGDGIERFGALAGFAYFIWFVAAIAAYVISKNAAKDEIEKANKALVEKGKEALAEKEQASEAPAVSTTPKTEEELRAEIEEKVRREMIEKEVRERVEKEMAEKNK